jgi:hypothetical protein
MIIYYKLKHTKEFIKLLTIAQDDDEETKAGRSIWKNFILVKSESLNIVFAYAIFMLIFPAIFYELTVSIQLCSQNQIQSPF